jgi:hypothetical protein
LKCRFFSLKEIGSDSERRKVQCCIVTTGESGTAAVAASSEEWKHHFGTHPRSSNTVKGIMFVTLEVPLQLSLGCECTECFVMYECTSSHKTTTTKKKK